MILLGSTPFATHFATQLAGIAGDCFWLFVVAVLWGATNPLLKRGGKGISRMKQSNIFLQLIIEIKFLILNWRYVLPFLINQSGSVIFYLTLASVDLSLAVPITNSLTFLFTGLTGKLLEEDLGGKGTYIGTVLVVVGVSLCVYSKT